MYIYMVPVLRHGVTARDGYGRKHLWEWLSFREG